MIGQTISHYKILEKLGEGGMGIVYKAHDTTLERDIALKFLPAHLSASEQDKARFIQEAKAAATLDHPNICTIYSIEEHEGQFFIAMQLVDGQLLRDRMSGATQKQAIEIGIQIAEGLAAAHEKGVVHRDIKPENIMIRKDGIAQIMDFGLAKLKGVSRLTKEGSTVGTAGYMSPEQVQGQDADHRSDIFSLGVLLYEMFTGQLPFKGVHETAIAYEIVNVDAPPMAAAKPEIDPALDAIVLECLEKDPKERTQSAGQVAVELKRYRRESSRQHASRIMPARPGGADHRPVEQTAGRKTSRLPWILAAALFVSTVALAFLLLSSGPPENPVMRLNVSAFTAPGQQILRADVPNVAISPDGRSLVYTITESGTTRLYLRHLDSFQARPIKGTENGYSPFFSPDGQWLGFAAEGKIKKIPLSGGSAEVLCDAAGFRGASWGLDNRIIFGPEYASPLMSISADGGDVQAFSILDSASEERTHRWPQILPDGKWVLYTIGNPDNPNSYADAQLALQSIATGERHILDVRGEMGRYIEPGYLLVSRNGTLLAAPFNLEERRINQQLSPVVSDLDGDPGSGVSYFSVSDNGHLVYLSGAATQSLELVWVTRDGKQTLLPLPPQMYSTPRLSPDGSKLAVTIGMLSGDDSDIWIYDFPTAVFTRLTFEKRMFSGIWSRDGKQLYYASAVTGNGGLMVKPADGSSNGTLLLPAKGPQYPTSISPNGMQVLVNGVQGFTSEGDIYAFDLNSRNNLIPLISSPAVEYGGQLSADGRYVSYISNETGSMEVNVRTYPDLKGKWQISTNGGFYPVWSPKGNEIFYLSGTGKIMAVPLEHHPTFSPGTPREVFDATRMYTPNNPIANFDISSDGQRFIFVRSTQNDAEITSFNIVLNWTSSLTRIMEKGE